MAHLAQLASRDVVLLETSVECAPRHAELLGGLRPVASARLERRDDAGALVVGAVGSGRPRVVPGRPVSRAGRREVAHMNRVSVAQNRSVGQRVLELPHVAGPRAARELVERSARDVSPWCARALGDAVEQSGRRAAGCRRRARAAAAASRHDVEAVVEVVAERARPRTRSARSRLVAAMMRTSTLTSRLAAEPRRTPRSCSDPQQLGLDRGRACRRSRPGTACRRVRASNRPACAPAPRR